ncbi:MAG TPA: YdeI/OmpD-associated family protein [Thermoanaerobaculia bacterium]|nr:YdeI/OmpD-associated family protein [Thermoanaerobaculia bacterium]
MGERSPQLDAYIAKAASFARPILEKLRDAFHKADPQIEESLKWGAPHFDHNGIVGSMAAFKQHVSWGFWKASLMRSQAAFREKVADVSELPPEKKLLELIREAVALNEAGVKIVRAPRTTPSPLETPDGLLAALRRVKGALATFEAFPPSHKREYAQWIAEAKQEGTRTKRIAQAVEWISEGKSRNWKYERKK